MIDDKNIKNIFGAALRDLRIEKGYTQEKLAEMLEMQTQSICQIETGKRFVSSEVLAKFCNFFQIEPYVLFLKRCQTYTPESLDHISQINSKLSEIHNFLIKNKK